jgi:hypothetical protein
LSDTACVFFGAAEFVDDVHGMVCHFWRNLFYAAKSII